MPAMTARAMLTLAALISAGSASAQADYQGAGQQSELDCDGGEARIAGAGNTIVVHGPCTLLSVQGASNIVTVDLAPTSTIRVVGSSNRITWRAPGKAHPRVVSTGADNRIRRAMTHT